MGFLSRAFAERKATQLTYDQIASLIDGANGGTVAGVAVNEKTALQVSTVLACVKVIADGCATPALEVFRYKPRGLPIVNWLLYTYGVPAACCFLGAWWLKRNEADRGERPAYDWMPGDRALAPAFTLLGFVLVFWLINVEIVDFFSTGQYVEYAMERMLARDLAMSVAWGLYAIVLLGLGIWKRSKGLRFLALGFIYLTFGKVLFYDVGWGRLSDLYRVLSLVSLAASMFVVALLFQRFVSGRERVG